MILSVIFVTSLILESIFGVATVANAAEPTIAIRNESTYISSAELQRIVAIDQKQLDTDVLNAWGVDATLIVIPPGTVPAGDWLAILQDTQPQDGFNSWHDIGINHLPLMQIDVPLAINEDNSVELALGHEIIESLLNPNITATATVNGTKYAHEVCDPVEANGYGYQLTAGPYTGWVTDFTYPAWWQTGSTGPWDQTNTTSGAGQIAPRGEEPQVNGDGSQY